ncbi:hypothetical protein E0H77_12515 [Acinetobacter sp. ANC 4633]|nr:hypothetical protein E0H77_12515 [Acinetobacter sp. ANC 4633]
MRVYGRITNPNGSKSWVVVTIDAKGFNDAVYVTALAQAIKLVLQESPFYGNVGIPQYQTIVTQVYPDFYVAQLQSQYAQYFASLNITRQQGVDPPTYNVTAITHQGSTLSAAIPI